MLSNNFIDDNAILHMAKHHKRKRMKGGMAFQNPDTGDIEHELQTPGETIEQFYERIKDSTDINDEQKINFFVKELADNMQMGKRMKTIKDVQHLREAQDNIKKIDDIINDIFPKLTGDKKIKVQNIYNDITQNKIEYKTNPMYEEEEKDAQQRINTGQIKTPTSTLSTVRGDISEETIEHNPLLYKMIDKDVSDIYNTKNLEAYNPSFIDKLMEVIEPIKKVTYIDLITLKNNHNPDYHKYNNLLQDFFLQYVPVDFVKDKTIWENKSFSNSINDKSGKQKMQNTKLDGYNLLWFKKKDPDIWNYNFYSPFLNGKPVKNLFYNYDINGNKINNIKFKLIGSLNDPKTGKQKNINIDTNIFKNNPQGYNYYWFYDNKDSFGYINPLKERNKIIKKQIVYNNKPEEYYFVDNKDIKIMPYTYQKSFSKKKNISELKQLNKISFKKLPKLKKK